MKVARGARGKVDECRKWLRYWAVSVGLLPFAATRCHSPPPISATDPSLIDPSLIDSSLTDPSLTDWSLTDPSVTDPERDRRVTGDRRPTSAGGGLGGPVGWGHRLGVGATAPTINSVLLKIPANFRPPLFNKSVFFSPSKIFCKISALPW